MIRRLLRAAAIWRYWREIDEECERERVAAPPRTGYDYTPLIVLVTVAVSLTIQEYWGQHADFSELFPWDGVDKYYNLESFSWWVGWRFFGYVIMPFVAVLLMPGERLRDYFISAKGFISHLWIYVLLFAIVFPAVWLASQTHGFQMTYPFYKWANRSRFDFWAWESMYALQFLSLEIFFRGFMLRGLRSFGSKAIFVMIVPYCMIHYGKPMPETLGAILAGMVLGTLAMRTKSIWGGVMIHMGVALTMDNFALLHCPAAATHLPCIGH